MLTETTTPAAPTTDISADAPLSRSGTLFHRFEGTLYGPIDVVITSGHGTDTRRIRVPADRGGGETRRMNDYPLTEAGLRRAVADAPELDPGDEHYPLLLVLPACGSIEGMGGELVREPVMGL